jgi:hypothetical protein
MAENDTASASSATPTEELDLMIPDMDTETAETRSRKSWRGSRDQVPPLVQRGALVRYNPASIGPDENRTAIRQSGFRTSTFQDSKTGRTASPRSSC